MAYGIHDNYPPGWPGPCYPPPPPNPIDRHPPNGTRCLSIQEQMGIDPVSKLATAIEKLADAIKSEGIGG